MAFGDRHLQRVAQRGPVTGGVVPVTFVFGGNAGAVDATFTQKWRAPFACRIQSVTSATGAANTGSPTFDVTTTAGTILSGAAIPSNSSTDHSITSVTSAFRDMAKGDILSVVFTDVGGSTVATGFTVVVAMIVKDFPQDDEAND